MNRPATISKQVPANDLDSWTLDPGTHDHVSQTLRAAQVRQRKKPGLYWHVHHDRLYEYCYDPKERIAYIKSEKPKAEIETRLRLMLPIKGTLGDPKAMAAYAKAMAAHTKAWAAHTKAWAAHTKARAAYDKAMAAHTKAWAAYDKARAAYDKAEATIKPGEAETLHARECPNCPWDGKTIFPKRKSK